MNDDPKKQSGQTKTRPQTVKMSDEEFERFYADICREFGPASSYKNEDLTKDVPIRNHANGYGSAPAAQPSRSTAPAANRNTYADNNHSAPPVKKDNSIKALTIAVCLECLGIVGVVLWWLLMIL